MTDSADILRGAERIADHIGESVRKTYYWLERGYLPAYKIGDLWEMRASDYREMNERKRRAALARACGERAASG